MKLYLLCFVNLFVLINNTNITQGICPDVCNCIPGTSGSDQCTICLEKQFKRNFQISNSTCPCINNYIQNYPPTDYCCAKNCTLCYWQGCHECRSNWTKTRNGAYFICVCKENYYYDPDLDDCICLGDYQQYATQYFEASQFLCYLCPKYCKCNFYGCLICDQQSNRRIVKIKYQDILFYKCKCKSNYTESDGLCVPTKNIKIKCYFPLTRSSNDTCLCDQPYYNDTIYGCICKSSLFPASYYLYRGICYKCPNNCKCNQYGCVYCSILAYRQIKQNHCTCYNYAGIFQLNGQCVCLSPYNRSCLCNNLAYPQLFFTNSNNQCKKCPQGCECDKSGCKSCNSKSKRNQTCQCIWPYVQLDGQCIGCPQNFILLNSKCVCPYSIHPTQYYYDFNKSKCNLCPQYCECDQRGCYHCFNKDRLIQQQTHPNLQSQNVYYTCNCNTAQKFRYNIIGATCQCMHPFVFNQQSENCTCQPPYVLRNSQCVCSSQINSSAYYSYSDTDCRRCPLECNCSEIGCYSCSSRTGRIILIGQSSNYICPCFPIQKETNQYFCMTCNQNQYLWQNKCIDCDQSCKTCDENGCLTCHSSLNLQNRTCICSNNFYYYNGSCICQEGFFMKQTKCVACPKNCLICQLNSKVQNMIQCIQCNIAMFRKNDTIQQCPCMDYYVEAFIRKQFCCHWSCKDCNISGCISCLPFSYRQLNYNDKNNFTCSCISGFVQNYQIVCSCPPQKYKYYNKCQACPSYCLQCKIVSQIISCTKCVTGLHRQKKINQHLSTNNTNSIIFDCLCVMGYQSYPNQPHCYPKSCKEISGNGLCAICGPYRTQKRNVSYCNCTQRYFEDQSYKCLPCYEGCIKCISYDICEKCDINNDYYLVFNKKLMVIICVKPDFNKKIFYQEKGNIILKIKGINTRNNQTLLPKMQQLSTKNLSLYMILLTENITVSTIKLNVLQSKIINANVLLIKFNNLTNDQLRPFLLYINSTNQYRRLYQKYYLMENYVYSKNTISYSNVQEFFIYLFIVLIMITSLIIHILGEKHNQLMYYCQTIYFIAMNVKDHHMYLVPFLNYFRITTFNFTLEDSGSPFNDALSDWTIYFQKSYGNYRYFSVDNNLIRNVGLALYLAIQNLCLEIIFRIIYAILFRSKYKLFAKKYKKIVYRSIQWMRKTTIYPLVFFSLSTLILYQSQYSFIDLQFRQLNKSYAIAILVLYTIGTTAQFIFEQISRIYRYELLIEYFFNIINPIIIINSLNNQQILFALIPSILLKSILQFIKYRLYMRKFQFLYYYINILYLVECLIIIPIYFCSIAGTVILVLLYIIGISIVRLILVNRKHKQSNLEKKLGKIEQIETDKQCRTQQKMVSINNKSQQIFQFNTFQTKQ